MGGIGMVSGCSLSPFPTLPRHWPTDQFGLTSKRFLYEISIRYLPSAWHSISVRVTSLSSFSRFLRPVKADRPWPTFSLTQVILDPNRLTYIAQTAFLDQSCCEIWVDP